MLETSAFKSRLLGSQCSFTQDITVNGMAFASGQYLPEFSEDKKIHEIFDIVVAEPKNVEDIFAVCRTYSTITENEHYCAYSFKKDSQLEDLCLINIKNFLLQHHYPVAVHCVGGEFLFRCKRF